tara:strand:- start:213 stop:479 length:267 start_codon:yes stop_codon:yes gene_type:complete
MHFSRQFKNEPQLKKRFSELQRVFLTPSIVVESGRSHITGWRDKSNPTHGRYTAVYMKKGAKWLIVYERAWWISRTAPKSCTKANPAK